MTRKDYILIASVIKSCRKHGEDDVEIASENRTIFYFARLLADKLSVDNPRFDRTKFLQACGCQTYSEMMENK